MPASLTPLCVFKEKYEPFLPCKIQNPFKVVMVHKLITAGQYEKKNLQEKKRNLSGEKKIMLMSFAKLALKTQYRIAGAHFCCFNEQRIVAK